MSELLLSETEEEQFSSFGDNSLEIIRLRKEVKALKRRVEEKDMAYKSGVAALKREQQNELDDIKQRQTTVIQASDDLTPLQHEYIKELEVFVLFLAMYEDIYHDNQHGSDFGAAIVNIKRTLQAWVVEHVRPTCTESYGDLAVKLGFDPSLVKVLGTRGKTEDCKLTQLKQKLDDLLANATIVPSKQKEDRWAKEDNVAFANEKGTEDYPF